LGLVNELANSHDVLLVTTNYALAQIGKEWKEMLNPKLSYEIEGDTRMRFQQPPGFYFRTYRAMMRRLREFAPDIIHFQETHNPPLILVFLLLRKKQPFILTVHDPEPHTGESIKGYALRKPLLDKVRHRATRILTLSEFNKKELLRIYPKMMPDHIHVVLHGVMDFFLRWKNPQYEEQKGNVLFFGRMQKYKGLDVLLKAWEKVKNIPEAKLVLAGTGPELNSFENKIKEDRSIELYNRFLESSEIARLMCEASCVVLPYIEATQSGVLAISVAFGKPNIVTRTGGLPEMVDDGENAIIVPPNDPSSLADSLIRILSDDELRMKLAQGTRELAETKLSWNTLARQIEEMYFETL